MPASVTGRRRRAPAGDRPCRSRATTRADRWSRSARILLAISPCHAPRACVEQPARARPCPGLRSRTAPARGCESARSGVSPVIVGSLGDEACRCTRPRCPTRDPGGQACRCAGPVDRRSDGCRVAGGDRRRSSRSSAGRSPRRPAVLIRERQCGASLRDARPSGVRQGVVPGFTDRADVRVRRQVHDPDCRGTSRAYLMAKNRERMGDVILIPSRSSISVGDRRSCHAPEPRLVADVLVAGRQVDGERVTVSSRSVEPDTAHPPKARPARDSADRGQNRCRLSDALFDRFLDCRRNVEAPLVRVQVGPWAWPRSARRVPWGRCAPETRPVPAHAPPSYATRRGCTDCSFGAPAIHRWASGNA